MSSGFAVGIYTTNSPEACQYVASDSTANVIVVENTVQLKKILKIRDNLPNLKALIQYTGDIEEPQPNLYTWEEFMKAGDDIPDSMLEERFCNLAPNKCCTLIYTVSCIPCHKISVDYLLFFLASIVISSFQFQLDRFQHNVDSVIASI
ncbi:hypothetical protein SNE40_018101 [Patella caerulea]|uniref:Uncharacterized protein n=1 Tax=Patella caerulea TaxID=87958 RepID=A0AAN8PAA3_PATCE